MVMDNRIILFLLLSFSFLVLPNLVFSEPLGAGNISLEEFTNKLFKEHPSKSGAFVLEKGEDALLTRALLTDLSANSIDVQYFIWSTDNIGILAAESLLRAAERGTHVRVIVDGNVAITGGRNMADEYFDYDSEYNFRDRDILLLGPVVAEMEKNFERFWQSHLTVSVESLLEKAKKSLTEKRVSEIYSGLHAYALNPENYEPEVQQSLNNISDNIPHYAEELIWEDILFVSDIPGKNTSSGFQGGGKSTETLVEAVKKANKSITIQSPYLVFPNGGIDFFGKLINKGVEVKIITNSLAATASSVKKLLKLESKCMNSDLTLPSRKS
jgi:phosphatidylserine/phosphatidylglycerophosphate/cardiolipin synthase-like enzyme